MSSPTVIRAENVSKKYVISHLAKQQTLRDAMHHGLRLVWRRLRWNARLNREEFWALKDVSFEVKQGEVLGIIGRNGAGKSTLLKVLSRITEPTTGRISLNGRVASLLEVGTGFHPELTGRENIFLNGAILGMTRAEVRAKFDEIVAFAEIDQFIDTPVKRYSSGMYVRLAFAVAAHLEPEILIVDEVLAVGDAQFQKKCLGKMHDVAQGGGRTVFFVSHNLVALQSLCSRAIYLRGGSLIGQGTLPLVLTRYMSDLREETDRPSGGARRVAPNLGLVDLSFAPQPAPSLSRLTFKLSFQSSEGTSLSDVCLLLYSRMGIRVAVIDLRRAAGPYAIARGGGLEFTGNLAALNLVEGDYSVGLYIRTPDFQGDLLDVAMLEVSESMDRLEVIPYAGADRGLVELGCEVRVEETHP